MINQKLLVSGTDYFNNTAHINPYYTNDVIDQAKAAQEHALLVSCFKQAGIEVIEVPPPTDCQDGVYTANWAIVHNGTAILSNLPSVRKPEQPYAKQVLENLGLACIDPTAPHLFSGQGDSLICGNRLFAGSGYRSTPEAQKIVADAFGLELIQLHALPKLNDTGSPFWNAATNNYDSFFYDLDLALAVIDENTIAYCPEAFDDPSRRKLADLDIDKILVDREEAVTGFACNLVSTGQTVIMSAHAPKLQAELQKRGLATLTPEITELKKGGGYIRCVSLILS
ncbi:arginine deiminase-related protein [Candidatus Saccharibacteria bacterium]|nr:arginine deiminase-related protein [Candidatus Saccharibacteria bacterium]